jgi:hypothetical protein
VTHLLFRIDQVPLVLIQDVTQAKNHPKRWSPWPGTFPFRAYTAFVRVELESTNIPEKHQLSHPA